MLLTKLRQPTKQPIVIESTDIDDAFMAELKEVAQDAKQKLRYRKLADRLELGEDKSVTTLATALKKLQIDVYPMEEVNQYKKDFEFRYNLRHPGNFLRKRRFEKSSRSRYYRSSFYAWQKTDLDDCGEDIPVHVLRKCLQIKQVYSDAIFEVHAFHNREYTLDPFLTVRHGYEEFCIEFWNEPGFGV